MGRFIFDLTDDLAARIEAYRVKRGFKATAQAVRELIELGLGQQVAAAPLASLSEARRHKAASEMMDVLAKNPGAARRLSNEEAEEIAGRPKYVYPPALPDGIVLVKPTAVQYGPTPRKPGTMAKKGK